MTPPRALTGLALLLACAGGGAVGGAHADGPAARLPELIVTRGPLTEVAPGRLLAEVPEVRAVLRSSGARRAELRIAYLGPSAETAPLASGLLRRQAGLKLLSQDECNLLYVMWRAGEPRALAVLAKRNPGQRTHAECGARGYRALVPMRERPVPPLAPGAAHVLAATLDGATLRVVADGVLAWEGDLPGDLAALRGPAGLRTDNGRFELELRAGP